LATTVQNIGLPEQVGERVFSLVAAVALIALVTNQRGPATLMSTPWLVRIGVWSYAIYLTHVFVFDAVSPLLPAGTLGDCLTLVVMLAIDLPIVWLLHTWVEKPLIAVGKRLAARIPAPASVTPATDLFALRDNATETVPVARRRA
jgi:peptidoglycan/LPS O-acetylase OafA/YrhL